MSNVLRSEQKAQTNTDRPVLAVVGATGAQGGGVVRAALADPAGRFTVRAITRNPESPTAHELAAAGAEVVYGDLDDLHSMITAFDGAHSIFGVTNFWEHLDPEREIAQATVIAQAAAKSGAQHVVWSTLEDVRTHVPVGDERIPTLFGKYKVPHMDAKAEADAIFAEAGVPTSYLQTSFYWENLILFGLRRDADGGLLLALPLADVPIPGIASADIGPAAYGIFALGEPMVGRRIGIAAGHLDGHCMASAVGAALGTPVRYVHVPFEQMAASPIPGAAELANMFQFKVDFNGIYRAARSVSVTRELHPGLQTFAQWVAENAAAIPVF